MLGSAARVDELGDSSALLGAVPEFDSISIVTLLVTLEEELEIQINDAEVTEDCFKSIDALTSFVQNQFDTYNK